MENGGAKGTRKVDLCAPVHLKLAHSPRSLAATLAALPSISEIPLKLVRVPTLSPLPVAALPSISEFPFPRFLD